MNIKLTDKEYIELKYKYYLGFKYIARNEKGSIKLFKEKPVRDKEANGTRGGYDTWIIGKYPIKDHSLYDEVKLGVYNFLTWDNGVWKISQILNDNSK